MELELDRDGPSNDERALRLEQERTRELGRELELQQETINLDRGLEKVDALSDMSLQCLPETELDFIKREISEFAFIKTGSPANIQELEYDPDRNLVLARCNGRSLQIELDQEGFEKPIEVREKLSELQTLEQAHQQLEKNIGHLEDMVRIAIDQHNKDALMQEIKIEQTSQGLIGVWNKLTGQIPEPYPSLYEKPLTHDDLARSLLIADVRTESFQQLLDNQMSDIRRYPQQIDEQLDRVVEQSRDHLESVKLETAAMVAGYELERTTKQPEIEPQLERSIEERPIVDERQQDARQEDLNPILNHDRELTRQEKLELSHEKIDDIREIYVNRIHEVNQELSDINAARQVEGYWEQSHEITQADTDRADLLLSQRLNLYEILDRTPDEQQAYLDQHPEFDLVLNERDYDKVQVALDDLSENMPKPITLENNPDDYKVGVWDSVKESVIDTAKTVDAFVEVAVADGLNTGTKIGMNVGAVTLGAYHGIKEGSLDEGITAMREIRDGAVEDYKIEASQSSQEILANSENLQAVGTAIHEGMEYGYNKVGEHLGDEAQFIARGAMEAAGDILTVTGAGLGARSIAKTLDYTVVNFKYAQIETNLNIAHHIRNFDGYDPKNGIKGAHNKENFTQALNDNNLQITKEVQGSKGISEVYYGREKVNGRGEPDGFKDFSVPKTIYDSKIYSDEQILQMGKKAAVMGYDDAIVNGKRYYTEKIEGINFRVYVDPITKEITNFHPSLKGK